MLDRTWEREGVILPGTHTIAEVKDTRDKAEAMRAYSKQAEESLIMQNICAEIKLRAERKGGKC